MFDSTYQYSFRPAPRALILGLVIAALSACTGDTSGSSSLGASNSSASLVTASSMAVASSSSAISSVASLSSLALISSSSVTTSSAAMSSALSSQSQGISRLTTIEAEDYDAASQLQPFESQNDNGRTIMVWPSIGEQNIDPLDNAAGQLFYTLVASGPSITLYATVNFSDASNDSFFYKLDGKDTTWAAQNLVTTSGYEELQIATWTGLTAGQSYTLKIQRREDGAKLDSFRIVGGDFAYGQEAASSVAASSSSTATTSSVSATSSSSPAMSGGQFKHRLINTSDIHPNGDPDDWQSMVRQLVMSDIVDIEGLIPTTGCWVKSQNGSGMTLLNGILDAYAQSYNNLKVHGDFPTPEYLRSISVPGQTGYGMGGVGAGKDSPGSELIIKAVDKDDPRPVWTTCWGGCNTIAQAVWKVQNTRTKAELDKFISKIRVYDVLGQGEAGNWLAQTFPNLLFIRATGVYGWQEAKNGAYYQKIQSLGPLGAKFPDTKYAPEGDTPAFMHVVQPGLNNPDDITQGGWGGRFNKTKTKNIKGMSCMNSGAYNDHFMHGNLGSAADIKKWSDGYNNDLLARMQWSTTSNYKAVNHHPIIVLNGQEKMAVMTMNVQAGTTVALNASASRDPDANNLNYAWQFYKEPSSYGGSVSIAGGTSSIASIQVPSDAGGKSIHIILTLKDNGSPSLTAYRRVILNVK
ncbi:MAG: DUF1593 domain-containing protein [Marinagarivorans sp.]|nr:DUF1593 domain-containing protein [Marinagarivorans sp.]